MGTENRVNSLPRSVYFGAFIGCFFLIYFQCFTNFELLIAHKSLILYYLLIKFLLSVFSMFFLKA